jgi:hypothetical protein
MSPGEKRRIGQRWFWIAVRIAAAAMTALVLLAY